MRQCSQQPKMIKWVLASLIYDSNCPLKNKLLSDETI